jgi:hypothetical protein
VVCRRSLARPVVAAVRLARNGRGAADRRGLAPPWWCLGFFAWTSSRAEHWRLPDGSAYGASMFPQPKAMGTGAAASEYYGL